jgi:hypothetical protein
MALEEGHKMLGTALPMYHRESEAPMNHSMFEAMKMLEVGAMSELMRAGNSHGSNPGYLQVDLLASWALVFGELDRASHLLAEANCYRSTEKNGVKRNQKR